jgi:hydrogenase expression/formation protein HypC
MCLAIPAKITRVEGTTAVVDMQGNETAADISLVPEARVGDYVIVHAGLAIERYDEAEALKTLELFRQLAESDEADGER